MNRYAAVLALCAAIRLSAAGGGPIRVATGIPPLAFVVEKVGGNRVAVEALLRPGDNPHVYEPTPRQIGRLAGTDVFVSVGLPFERTLERTLRGWKKGPRVVRAEAGLIAARNGDAVGHPGPEGAQAHSHAHEDDPGLDPHVWLAPAPLAVLAGRIAEGLSAADPGSAALFEKNLALFRSEIDSLDAAVRFELAPFRGRAFLVFHPAFGRFAGAYGLRQLCIETEGRSPSPRQLSAVMAAAKRESIRTVFVEPQFDPHAARAVAAAVGGRIETLDPLARDVLRNLRGASAALAAAFGAPSGGGTAR